MSNLYQIEDLKKKSDNIKKLRKLQENINELIELEKTLKESIISLTKFEKYSSIRRRIEDLFVLHQDIKRSISIRKQTLERIKNEL